MATNIVLTLMFINFHTNEGCTFSTSSYKENEYYVTQLWQKEPALDTVETYHSRFVVTTAITTPNTFTALDEPPNTNGYYPLYIPWSRAYRMSNTNRGGGTVALCCCMTNEIPVTP